MLLKYTRDWARLIHLTLTYAIHNLARLPHILDA